MSTTANLDRSAALFSIACIAHCVALPILALSLPFLAAIADAEWVHWLLTLFAIAASTAVIATSRSARTASFLIPAVSGLVLIASALVAEPLGIDETIPTVAGGCVLAFAHLRRLISPT